MKSLTLVLRSALILGGLLAATPACNNGDDALNPGSGGTSASGGVTGTGTATGGTNEGTGGVGNATGGVTATGGNPATGGTTTAGTGGTRPMNGASCFSGTCSAYCTVTDEGGCGSTTWSCGGSALMGCTADIATLCGCDGKTFQSPSGSCISKAWAYRGTCEEGIDCNPTHVLCKRAITACPVGYVHSVSGSCYGPCVKPEQCVCNAPADCPEGNIYTCHNNKKRCGPFLN
jgi:hypothetical protein